MVEQVSGTEGFSQHAQGPGGHDVANRLLVRISRRDYYFHLWVQLPELLELGETVHAGQRHIQTYGFNSTLSVLIRF